MTKRWFGIGGFVFAAIGTALGVAAAAMSCQQTPANVPVRSFEQAQKMDVVCLHQLASDGGFIEPPRVAPPSACSPVAPNVVGATLPYHLFAVVTQTTRGELAVVDLTSGVVVDEDRSTPGTNFIPVGTEPTDVVVSPDSRMTFVASAAPNKPAIYGIRNDSLLGDYAGLGAPPPLRLTDLQACELLVADGNSPAGSALHPQAPQAITVASRPDGGYVIVAALRSAGSSKAKIVTIDPASLVPTSPPIAVDDAGADDAGREVGDGGAQPSPPGMLLPCNVRGQIELQQALPPSWTPGPAWPDGVPYADAGQQSLPTASLGQSCGAAVADGGVDQGSAAEAGAGDAAIPLSVRPLEPPHPTSIVLRDDAHVLYVADDSTPVIHVIDVSNPDEPLVEQAPLLATSTLDPLRQVSVGAIAISPPTSDFKRYLYAVDKLDSSLMVFDVTDPLASGPPLQRPHPELNPFAAPDRIALPGPIASVAFVQHDWPLPSQAAGESPNPIHQYTGILCNPNPHAHPDAGAFPDLGAYYRVDQAGLIQPSGTLESFPYRLRGVFAFVTLSNGNIFVIDVDDWDAPCRRPDPMATPPVADLAGAVYDAGFGQTGSLDLPQPPAGTEIDSGTFFDPYHAPIAYNSALSGAAPVTLEPFFPVSAPHRLRSNFVLLDDPVAGIHVPYLLGTPGLFDATGAPLPTSGSDSEPNPVLLPTALPPGWIDESYLQNPAEPNPLQRLFSVPGLAKRTPGVSDAFLLPGAGAPPGVRVSFDDPTAHQDQDWTITYEGAIPSVSGIAAEISKDPVDDYNLLRLDTGGAALCSRGIEDFAIGQWRAQRALDELSSAKLPQPACVAAGSCASLPQWTSDYVEIVDDILPRTDGYWGLKSNQNDCWDGSLADDSRDSRAVSSHANDRYNTCLQAFGASYTSSTYNVDSFLARDFPIIEAYDGYLRVGRFGWEPKAPLESPDGGIGDGGMGAKGNSIPESTRNRVVVPSDPSNRPFLRFAQCCFHRQASFKVRTGGEWVAVGTASGMLHHVVAAPGDNRCVLSCDPRLGLLNSRAFDIPWSATAPPPGKTCPAPTSLAQTALDRDSPLAMRNPMFSFLMWSGCGTLASGDAGAGGSFDSHFGDHTLSARDEVWRFSLRGSFSPIVVSLAQGMNIPVSPQSMRFINPLGQLAVVDGAQQGLVLIDLNTIAFAHTPYF